MAYRDFSFYRKLFRRWKRKHGGAIRSRAYETTRGYLKTAADPDSSTGAKKNSGIWHLEEIHAAKADFVPAGEHAFNTAGTYNFTVPDKVESVSIVCVGSGGRAYGYYGGYGGNLSYSNSVSVTPGETLTVTVGAAGTSSNRYGNDSKVSRSGTDIIVAGGAGFFVNSVGDVTNAGGSVGARGSRASTWGTLYFPGGAGGAAGYSGDGGRGGNGTNSYGYGGAAGQGGGGAGGGGGSHFYDNGSTIAYARGCAPGGGVGLYGESASGAAGSNQTSYGTPGAGGSGGGTASSWNAAGGAYGGGGGGAATRRQSSNTSLRQLYGQNGGGGAVRIIWGEDRSFPSTNVDEASSDGNVSTN